MEEKVFDVARESFYTLESNSRLVADEAGHGEQITRASSSDIDKRRTKLLVGVQRLAKEYYIILLLYRTPWASQQYTTHQSLDHQPGDNWTRGAVGIHTTHINKPYNLYVARWLNG